VGFRPDGVPLRHAGHSALVSQFTHGSKSNTSNRQEAHKPNDLARRRRSAAWACSAARDAIWVATRMGRPYRHRITLAQRAFGRDHTQHRIMLCITGVHRNHAQHTTRLSRTGHPHNAPSNHTQHNGLSAQRAVAPRRHNGRRHAVSLAQRAFRTQDLPHRIKKECRPPCHGCRTVEFSRRERAAHNHVKKPTIARAQRSAGTRCSALRSRSLGLPPACADHTGTVPHRHNGRSLGTTPIWDHLFHNRRSSESRPSGITLPVTGFRHNGRSYHTLHNGQSAQRSFVARLHNARRHDGDCTTSVQEAQFASSTATKACQPRAPDAERVGVQVPRARYMGSPQKS